ncbi:Fungal specific transcription factor domain-containing protein [Cladophialophora immunda]|nr:Fungal specific transcription factor domain-containing protein [Cladophialophora immunda]
MPQVDTNVFEPWTDAVLPAVDGACSSALDISASLRAPSEVTQPPPYGEREHSVRRVLSPKEPAPGKESQPSAQEPVSPPATTSAGSCSDIGIEDVSEVHGPASYLSICSEPAVDWVSHHIGASNFRTLALRLTTDVMRSEKLERTVQSERTPEPDSQTAWKWTTAFFEQGLDAIFGCIHRPAFEQKLRAQFESKQPSGSGQDAAWYALRNTIYAAGCRITLSEGAYPSAFLEARTQAWRYFENALSVHTDLIYGRSGITAIQALLVMAFFAEALGSPALEYMLLSNAVRLAQSKGLHLQANKALQLRDEDAALRNVIWWNLYMYDKHLAYRSGRPSAIDDDDISCPIPTVVIPGHQLNLEFFRNTVNHAKISSLVLKRLSTVKAMQQSPEDTLTVVQDLHQELLAWYESLAPCFRSSPPYRAKSLPLGIQPQHVIFTRFIYSGSLIAMHAGFCQPWSRPGLASSSSPRVVAQRQRSTEIVASAARDIIMATQGLTVSAGSPVWLAFYFPLVGLINLFLHVIQHPTLPTANSDISLMDVVVGHFGYMEYASGSELVFKFPRKVVLYAREVVKRARRPSISQHSDQQPPNTADVMLPRFSEPCPDFPLPEFVTSDMSEIGFEDWQSSLADFADPRQWFQSIPR